MSRNAPPKGPFGGALRDIPKYGCEGDYQRMGVILFDLQFKRKTFVVLFEAYELKMNERFSVQWNLKISLNLNLKPRNGKYNESSMHGMYSFRDLNYGEFRKLRQLPQRKCVFKIELMWSLFSTGIFAVPSLSSRQQRTAAVRAKTVGQRANNVFPKSIPKRTRCHWHSRGWIHWQGKDLVFFLFYLVLLSIRCSFVSCEAIAVTIL